MTKGALGTTIGSNTKRNGGSTPPASTKVRIKKEMMKDE